MSYYLNSKSSKGIYKISSFVFSSIAQDVLETLEVEELKDQISLKLTGQKKNVATKIIDNKITINVTIFAIRNSNVQNLVTVVQKKVYEAVYEQSEISDIKVNVNLAGFVDKE